MKALPGVRVTLIDPAPAAAYSGMLPGFVAGHYSQDTLEIDLVRLARWAGARFIQGAVQDIDRAHKSLVVPGRAPIAYDIASLDVGITSVMPDLPGFSSHAVPAKPLGPFAQRWSAFRSGTGHARIAVIGAGVAGVELALAMAHAMKSAGRSATITLVDKGGALTAVRKSTAAILRRELTTSGILLSENKEPIRINPETVLFADGSTLNADLVVGAAGAQPHSWLGQTGLTDDAGFIAVNPYLQSADPAIFAVGDCAAMIETPRPKAGVYAVRQAPVLLHNVRAALSETGGLRCYTPQKDYLKLISLGAKNAVGERLGIPLQGPWVWRWKDRIDQRFMDKLSELPTPLPPTRPWPRAAGDTDLSTPLCGGCGAKVGAPALQNAIKGVVPAAGDDAAILQTGRATQVISTDHLRALVEDPAMLARIAAIHALGDIWAMGARAQAATSTIILPRQSERLAERAVAEILATAQDVFATEGASVVGGHTTFGTELTIGFTVTGLCETTPITVAGAKPGDTLILTKPIGTGVIMAADMAARARGWDVSAALTAMTQSQNAAARILAGANAMTDVTGFGLAGHLNAVCRASDTGAELVLDAIPVLPGAMALAQAKIRSSLFAQNRRVMGDLPQDPRIDLLFDPQTCGGLLAAVSAPAKPLCAALREAGFAASIIGTITDIPGQIDIV